MQSTPLTITLIFTILAVSIWAFNDPDRIERYGLNPHQMFKHKQWDRLILHGFLHGGAGHLFFNLFTLLFFGTELELFFSLLLGPVGGIAYITLFISGIIIASIPDILYQRHNPKFLSIGASGGVATLIFTTITLAPSAPVCLYGVLCFPGAVWGIGFIAYSVYQNSKPENTSRVNFKAHIAGAAWGVFIGLGLIFLLLSL